MKNICRVCGSEKTYDEYHRMFKRCDSCNTKHALKYHYNNNKIREKRRKNTIIITNNSLVKKTKNKDLKYLILKVKLAH